MRAILIVATLSCQIMLLTGCKMPLMGCQITPADIVAMQPQRAPELDRLERLLGSWDTEGSISMMSMETPVHTTGHNEASWALDRRFLIEHAELDMGELGKITGMSIWWWDPAIRKYRMEWLDSLGETSHAVVTFNERTDTWHMKAVGQKYGHKTSGRGTLKHIDDNTLEWTWKEYDSLGLFQLADMKGTSKRKVN